LYYPYFYLLWLWPLTKASPITIRQKMSSLKSTLKILAERALALLPKAEEPIHWDQTICARWMHDGQHHGQLRALTPRLDQTFDGLLGVDRQIKEFRANIELFLRGLPANATLLWGARGTGKSSMIQAALAAYHDAGLRIIEVEKAYLSDLPSIVECIR
jgi:predicted AAA+ superfamily ATPase